MSYDIVGARRTSDPACVILRTTDAGDVAVSERDRPELWEKLLEWVAAGGVIQPIPELTIAERNVTIDAELAANDLKIIRAITEGDVVRIEAHKKKQAELRARRR